MNKNEVFIHVPKFVDFMSTNPAAMLNVAGIALRETGHPAEVWEPLLGPTPEDFEHLDLDEKTRFSKELVPLLSELPPIPAHEAKAALEGGWYNAGSLPVDFHKYMVDRVRDAAESDSPSEIMRYLDFLQKIDRNARQFIVSGGAYRMIDLTNRLNMIYLYSLMGGKYLEKKKEITDKCIRSIHELFLSTITFEQWVFVVSSYDI